MTAMRTKTPLEFAQSDARIFVNTSGLDLQNAFYAEGFALEFEP